MIHTFANHTAPVRDKVICHLLANYAEPTKGAPITDYQSVFGRDEIPLPRAAYRFNGVDNVIPFPTTGGSNESTHTFWLKPKQATGDQVVLWENDDPRVIYNVGNQEMVFITRDGIDDRVTFAPDTLQVDVWVHVLIIVWRFGGPRGKYYYINGELEGEVRPIATTEPQPINRISGNLAGTQFAEHDLADFRYWSDELDEEDRKKVFQGRYDISKNPSFVYLMQEDGGSGMFSSAVQIRTGIKEGDLTNFHINPADLPLIARGNFIGYSRRVYFDSRDFDESPILIPAAANITPDGQPFSMTGWFARPAVRTDSTIFQQGFQQSGVNFNFSIYFRGANRLLRFAISNGAQRTQADLLNVDLNKSWFFTVTYAPPPGNITIYMYDAETEELYDIVVRTSVRTIPGTLFENKIGGFGDNPNARPYEGTIWDLQYHNVELTQPEIEDIFLNRNFTLPSVVSHWPLRTDSVDIVGGNNGIDGANVGYPVIPLLNGIRFDALGTEPDHPGRVRQLVRVNPDGSLNFQFYNALPITLPTSYTFTQYTQLSGPMYPQPREDGTDEIVVSLNELDGNDLDRVIAFLTES